MWLDLGIPPGVRAVGTERGSRGAWRDTSLVRWNPDLQPVGGWAVKSTTTVTGKGRAMLGWTDNNNSNWLAIGTEQKLYVMTASGVLHDITPSGFTPGDADAVVGGGYGTGVYGSGVYGDPRSGVDNIVPASVWTLALWNDRLVGCMEGDGNIYQWDLDPSFPAAVIGGAPTGVSGIVVTEDAILMALTGRTAAWSNQGDNTDWLPTSLNQAGDLALNCEGLLMCGRKVRGRTLLFTTSDLWEAIYQGPPVVYGFQKAGSACGPVSKGSPVVIDTGRCVWMGTDTFYLYNGYVQAIPCEVEDKVFTDINTDQISKVSGWHNPRFGEVWWHYPSAASAENDRYVVFNYRLNAWSIGALARTAGATYDNPLLCGADGYIYTHETGEAYGGVYPYAQSGPFEWPDEGGFGGSRVMVRGIIPDEKTIGTARVKFYNREYPNLSQTVFGPYTIATAPVDFMFTARQVEMKVEFLDGDGRWGIPRLDVVPIGKR